MDAATAGLVGALGATALAGLIGSLNERFRARNEWRSTEVARKRELYARFLFTVSEMSRGAVPEARWTELRDELGRLKYELLLVAPLLETHVEALAFDVSVHTKHDRAHSVISFEGGAAWDDHWDPLLREMREDLGR